jgi:MFS family permease
MRASLMRVADFRNLFLSHSVSLVGTQVTVLALPILALMLLDATALQVSLLAAVEFLPMLLLGLPAGAWVDRLPHKPILIATDAVRGTALLAVPVAFALGGLTLPLLYVVAFVIGLGTLFYDVAQQSYLPALVEEEQLGDANAKLEGSRSVAQLAGPSIGGFLVQLLTAPVAIVVDAVSYLASAILLLFVRGRATAEERTEHSGLLRDIGEGLRFVLTHPLMGPLAICAAAADLAFAAVLALQIVFALETLHLSAGVTGIVLAVGNAGGLIGAFLCTALAKRIGPGAAILASIAVFSGGALVVPMAGEAVGLAAGLFFVYLGVVIFNILHVTLCQAVTPPRMLGRMNATLRFITWGMVPVGATAGGLLVDPVGLRGVLWIAAGVCALSILPPLFSPVRTLENDPTTDAPAVEPVTAEEEL